MLANQPSYMYMHARSRVFPTLIGFIFSSTSLRNPPASKAGPYSPIIPCSVAPRKLD
jgi:hypothetical protein